MIRSLITTCKNNYCVYSEFLLSSGQSSLEFIASFLAWQSCWEGRTTDWFPASCLIMLKMSKEAIVIQYQCAFSLFYFFLKNSISFGAGPLVTWHLIWKWDSSLFNDILSTMSSCQWSAEITENSVLMYEFNREGSVNAISMEIVNLIHGFATDCN